VLGIGRTTVALRLILVGRRWFYGGIGEY